LYFFFEWELNLKEQFSSLFTATPSDESGNPFTVTMQDNLKWIAMIHRLAGGDITKHDAVYKLNYIECLNLLSFLYYQDKMEDQIRRQQKLNSSLR
jgi:hypothetical protein